MKATEILRIFSFIVGYAFVLFSLVPLIRSDYWFVRIFDYPRSQKFWVNTSVIVMILLFGDFENRHDIVFLIVLLLNEVHLFFLIWRYTPLASIQMQRNKEHGINKIRLLIANVYQDNEYHALCAKCIKKYDPDLVLLVETDERWYKALQPCLKPYPYSAIKIQDNTYGIMLYSKFQIASHQIRNLIESDVPSIQADIKLPDGLDFRMYCLHPKPPVPSEANDSTERDAEILIIGKEAKRCKQPVIVAGDLNDVAWSYTTKLFLKVSGLLDPRIGRGFFSTFHAKYPMFRWPLDHVFCSSHFLLQRLQRLPDIGSDHFPILIEVALMPEKPKENKEQEQRADHDELALASEKIQEAHNKNG